MNRTPASAAESGDVGSPLVIVEARSAAHALHPMFRLRYDVYVSELGFMRDIADHARRELRDDDDECATHLSCVDAAGEVIGSVRVHVGPLPDRLAAAMLVDDHFRDVPPHRIAYVSKLLVRDRARHTRAALKLFVHVYEHIARADRALVLCKAFPDLAPMYQKLGFHAYGAEYDEPHLGRHVRMRALVGEAGDILRRCSQVEKGRR